jgi:Dolichyl-phosphate-mannose-protein mannosyltransferase
MIVNAGLADERAPAEPAAATGSAALTFFLFAHVLLWTLFASYAQGGIHHDLAEVWAWAREPALGYDKHPPLSAWVAAAWFSVWPRATWSFFLLAEVNAALGLAGAYALAGRLVNVNDRWAAMLLLCLTPFYNLLAMKFNANTVLLAVWPWTAFFLVRSLETRAALPSLALGVLAGLAILGKYYSALLLASCGLAALLHPEARAYFASPAPYAAITAFVATIAPHVHWMATHGAPTVGYALTKTEEPRLETLVQGAVAAGRAALFLLPAAIVLLIVVVRRRQGSLVALARGLRDPAGRWLLALALGPFALSLLACVVGNVRISVDFMIPIFFALPTAVLALSGIAITDAERIALSRTVAGFMAVMLLVLPVVALGAFYERGETWLEPRREVALAATRAWHEAFGRPLPVVSGEATYADALSFYSPDAPRVRNGFVEEDSKMASWLPGPEGLLVVCPYQGRWSDDVCLKHSAALGGPGVRLIERDFAIHLWGLANPSRHVVLTLVPPAEPAASPQNQ